MIKKDMTVDMFGEDIISPKEKPELSDIQYEPAFPVIIKSGEYYEIFTAEGTRLTLKLTEKISSITIGHEDWTFKTNSGYKELIKRKVNNGKNVLVDINELVEKMNIASEKISDYIQMIVSIATYRKQEDVSPF